MDGQQWRKRSQKNREKKMRKTNQQSEKEHRYNGAAQVDRREEGGGEYSVEIGSRHQLLVNDQLYLYWILP